MDSQRLLLTSVPNREDPSIDLESSSRAIGTADPGGGTAAVVTQTLVPTGDPRVDAAIAGLASLADTDPAGRPAVLAEVHDRLREILGELGDPGRDGQAASARPGEPGRRGEQPDLLPHA